jgi:hypothetical protein
MPGVQISKAADEKEEAGCYSVAIQKTGVSCLSAVVYGSYRIALCLCHVLVRVVDRQHQGAQA